MDKLKSKKCSRLVLEKKIKEEVNSRDWWNELIRVMEKEAYIKSQKYQKEVLMRIFPNRLLKKIVSLLQLQLSSNKSSIEAVSKESKLSLATIPSMMTQFSDISEIGLDEAPSVKSESENNLQKCNGSAETYINFFKRPRHRAAIWRTINKSKKETSEMSIAEKAEYITEKIAVDFVKWLLTMGPSIAELNAASVHEIFHRSFAKTKSQDDNLSIPFEPQGKHQKEIQEIRKMFDINPSTEVQTSLVVAIKELPTVTRSIADYQCISKAHPREALKRELRVNEHLQRKRKQIFAFGTSLPHELKFVPPVKRTFRAYSGIDTTEILSMARVWDGITNLRSTKSYCKYLEDNPKAAFPPYLYEKVQSGELEQTKEVSEDSELDYINDM